MNVHTICVDFGTSSIRAGLRKERLHGSEPLPIAPGSSIDNASIPSAIFVPSSGEEIVFGVKALERGLSSKKALLFELSPKAWLGPGEIKNIDKPAIEGLPFTRRQVSAGLASVAFKASLRAAARSADGDFGFRISHPVWKPEHSQPLSGIYGSLRRAAQCEAGRKIKSSMTFSAFERWCKDVPIEETVSVGGVEIEEPVAATVELFSKRESDSRAAALIVDVGAGTIDLGLFSSIVPDRGSAVKQKLIEMAFPRSLYGAGDLIDLELLSMIGGRLDGGAQGQLAAFENNIRFHKEQLFKSGRLAFRGVEVSIDELTRSRRLKRMAKGLEEAVAEMLTIARPRIEEEMRLRYHPLEMLNVIFAGGGASLNFLQDTVEPAIRASGICLAAALHVAETPKGFPVEASLARMAVAMGGTVPENEWPERKWPDPIHRGLSSRRSK